MIVHDLLHVAEFIDASLRQSSLISKYDEAVKLASGNQGPPFLEARRAIVEMHRSLAPTGWPSRQLKIFNTIGASALLGAGAVHELDQSLLEFAGDNAQIANFLTTRRKEIAALHATANRMIQTLAPLVAEDTQPEPGPEEAALEITFRDEVRVDTLGDLESQAKRWIAIFRGIDRGLGHSPASPRVGRVERGSLLLELFGIASTILMMAKAADAAASFCLKLLQMRKTYQDIGLGPLERKKLELEIAELEDRRRAATSKALVETVIQHREDDKPADPEAIRDTENAVASIIEFVERGGEIRLLNKLDGVEPSELQATLDAVHDLRIQLKQYPVLEQPESEASGGTDDESTDDDNG